MSKVIIPADSTVHSVRDRLRKPDEYVRHVYSRMRDCLQENRSAYVRIGVMGEGKSPNYRIEYDVVGQTYPIPIHGSFHGRSYQKLVDEDALRDEHWSAKRMTYEDLEALFAEIRKRQPKH